MKTRAWLLLLPACALLIVFLFLRTEDRDFDREETRSAGRGVPNGPELPSGTNTAGNAQERGERSFDQDAPLASPLREVKEGSEAGAVPPAISPSSSELPPGRLQVGRFQKIPERALARAQVAANPHGTPPSLREFAREVAQELDRLDPNSSDARHFVQDLALCVAEPEAATSARAYCLSLLRDLAGRPASLLSRAAAEAVEKAPADF